METVTIIRGGVKMTAPKNEFIGADPTHDGIAFKFKGYHFYFTDNNYPQETKNIIKIGCDSFNGNLQIDLYNLKQPVSIDLG